MVAIVMRVDVDGVGQRLLQGFMTLYRGSLLEAETLS